MADVDVDKLGPVDYLVVEFPPGAPHFTGEMAANWPSSSIGDGPLLDLVILAKDDDGASRPWKSKTWSNSTTCAAETQFAEMLAADDMTHLAAAMEPARWPVSSSGRTSGPHRSPPPPAAPAANSSPAAGSRSRPSSPRSRPNPKKETDMPLRPVRAARRGVIGAPVARTAAVVGTAAVVAHGVNRRQDRREDRRDDRRDRR